jgi:hypothetical protein
VLIFVSLLLIGFQINWLAGGLVTLIFASLLLLVPTLLRATVAVMQGRTSTWFGTHR